MRCIRQGTSKDKEIINRLRINEFRRSKDFDLLLADQLKWSRLDEEQTVLVVWDNHKRPISTMRAVVVYDTLGAQDILQCTVADQVRYPAIVFNAAATRIENRGEGLNQVIRYHFLGAAIRQGIESILSPIYRGAPRIDFMKALGYQFVTPDQCWQTKLLPKSERILGILPHTKMQHALNYLDTHRGEAIDRYPWAGEILRLPVEAPVKVTVVEKREKMPLPDHAPPPLQDSGRPEGVDHKGSPGKKTTKGSHEAS